MTLSEPRARQAHPGASLDERPSSPAKAGFAPNRSTSPWRSGGLDDLTSITDHLRPLVTRWREELHGLGFAPPSAAGPPGVTPITQRDRQAVSTSCCRPGHGGRPGTQPIFEARWRRSSPRPGSSPTLHLLGATSTSGLRRDIAFLRRWARRNPETAPPTQVGRRCQVRQRVRARAVPGAKDGLPRHALRELPNARPTRGQRTQLTPARALAAKPGPCGASPGCPTEVHLPLICIGRDVQLAPSAPACYTTSISPTPVPARPISAATSPPTRS